MQHIAFLRFEILELVGRRSFFIFSFCQLKTDPFILILTTFRNRSRTIHKYLITLKKNRPAFIKEWGRHETGNLQSYARMHLVIPVRLCWSLTIDFFLFLQLLSELTGERYSYLYLHSIWRWAEALSWTRLGQAGSFHLPPSFCY